MSDKTTIVTHSGDFHADDVFAVATILETLGEAEDVEIIRTRDKEWFLKGDYVVDVGGEYDPKKNRFDHHQKGGAGERDNSIPYAAFGLVWKHFGKKLCNSIEVADAIDERFVAPLDANDMGIEVYDLKFEGVSPVTLPGLIYLFRPTWKEVEGELDATFLKLVEYARALLRQVIKTAEHGYEARTIVQKAYEESEDKRLIILDQKYPTEILNDYPEPLFVVYPSRVGDEWRGKAIRKDQMHFGNRKDFPAEWGGLRDGELAEVSGVKDAAFCHSKLFIIAAYSKEGILEMVKIALER